MNECELRMEHSRKRLHLLLVDTRKDNDELSEIIHYLSLIYDIYLLLPHSNFLHSHFSSEGESMGKNNRSFQIFVEREELIVYREDVREKIKNQKKKVMKMTSKKYQDLSRNINHISFN